MTSPSKDFSRGRRIARRLVWGLLATVLVVRYGFLREYYAEFHREQQREAMQARVDREWRGERGRGGGGRGWGGGRGDRPPMPVRQARTEVPRDFPRLQIHIAKPDVELLRSHRWNGWSGEQVERPKVIATVLEDGVTYSNVVLHLKGTAGSFRMFDDKPALTLDFSKHSKGRTFHGFPKISLNNSAQDDSYLCEIICREIFEAAGIPATHASHATVIINGRDLGLYVLAEGFGKSFLKRHFQNVGGNLYDSGFCRDIDSNLAANSGDHQEDHSDLKSLVHAAMEQDPVQRRADLDRVLDLDGFITYMALESLTCHWDGYSMNRNNYRIFHDLDTGKMVFLPHGMDQMFGVRRATPSSELLPPINSIVSRSVMALPGMEGVLIERIARLRLKFLEPKELLPHVDDLAKKIRPTLAAYGDDFVQRFDRAVTDLMDRIAERARSVDEQLQDFQKSGVSQRGQPWERSNAPRGMQRQWR